jgi:hypothetical protein
MIYGGFSSAQLNSTKQRNSRIGVIGFKLIPFLLIGVNQQNEFEFIELIVFIFVLFFNQENIISILLSKLPL